MYEYEVMYADDMSVIAGFDTEEECSTWIDENCTYKPDPWYEDGSWFYRGEEVTWSL